MFSMRYWPRQRRQFVDLFADRRIIMQKTAVMVPLRRGTTHQRPASLSL
jgi:hypothetical protein